MKSHIFLKSFHRLIAWSNSLLQTVSHISWCSIKTLSQLKKEVNIWNMNVWCPNLKSINKYPGQRNRFVVSYCTKSSWGSVLCEIIFLTCDMWLYNKLGCRINYSLLRFTGRQMHQALSGACFSKEVQQILGCRKEEEEEEKHSQQILSL